MGFYFQRRILELRKLKFSHRSQLGKYCSTRYPDSGSRTMYCVGNDQNDPLRCRIPPLEYIFAMCWLCISAVVFPPPSSPSPTRRPSSSSGDDSLPPLQDTQDPLGTPQPSLPIPLLRTNTQLQFGPSSLEWVETVTNGKLGQVVG